MRLCLLVNLAIPQKLARVLSVREFLRAKIHGATVTQALLDYEGSMGIDAAYLEQVGIAPFEAVEIYNITNGARVKTYAIPLTPGSKRFESNGAAAHLIRQGDRVIIAAYEFFTEESLSRFAGPKILILNPQNNAKKFYQPNWRLGSWQEPV